MKVSKNRIIQLLKIIVSLFLLAYVIKLIDWNNAISAVKHANVNFLLLALVLIMIERMVSVFKWCLLLRVKSAGVTFWRLFIINYIGSFWGLVLPSSVSVDIVRGYYLSRALADAPLAVSSVIADRVMGLLSLVFLGCCGAWTAGDRFGLAYQRIGVGALALLSMLGVFLIQYEPFIKWVDRHVIQRLTVWNLNQHLKKWLKSCLQYREFPGTMILVFLLSVLVQVIRVLMFYVVALSFDVQVPAIYYFIFIPLIMLLIMLPISIGGFGIREGSFVGFFSLIGMGSADAFVVSFTVSLLTTLTTACGGLIYLFDKSTVNPSARGSPGSNT